MEQVIKIKAIPSMQTTISGDIFLGELHFQNVFDFDNIACSIYGDIKKFFICFFFRKKQTVTGGRCLAPGYVRNWL